MRYRYEDLGDREFQQLIQALLAHSLGPTMRAMPLGKADGGRDALHRTTVYQVKFTISPSKVNNPVDWLLDALDNEMDKILALVARGARSYYLVTNVEGTGNLDTGTIDRLDREIRSRANKWLIEITPWWRETVDAQMNAAPNFVARSFVRALPPEQVLALTRIDQHGERRDRTLAAYMREEYEADDHIRFGEVDLLGPSVHKLFVDVRVASREHSSEPFRIMAQLGGKEGDQIDDTPSSPSGQWEAGGARLLLHPTWRGNALIVGGPGQGKTTLLQYVCQIYRSLHLDKNAYLDKHPTPHPHVARIPFRIDLRAYAEWLTTLPERRAKRDDAAESIEEYIAIHVSRESGNRTFGTDDLMALLAEKPAIIALDGLDEVADLAIREQVAAQIAKTARRLEGPDTDTVIIVTTRPGAASVLLKLEPIFPELTMQRLTKNLQLAYLRRWAEQTELDASTTDGLRRQFIANQNLPHVRELAGSTMQLAILLHLLQRRGILPEQRTELYTDYVKVFFDREAPKEPVVARHRKLVLALHRFLGWYLQAQAELGRSSGRLDLDSIRNLIGEFLDDYDRQNRPDLAALFTSVTSRVVCLVQRTSGAFEFEVQPLREYFAACYLVEGAPTRGSGTKDDRIAALIQRPYWSNVLRFFVGLLSEAEVKSLPTTIREVRTEKPFTVLPLTRSALIQLLRDQVYLDMTAVAVRGAVEAALEGPGCVLAGDGLLDDVGPQDLFLTDGTSAAQICEYARDRLDVERDPEFRIALARLLYRHERPERLRDWCWSDGVRGSTMDWLHIATQVHALSGLTPAEASHILECASTAGGIRRKPVFPLLMEAQSDIADGPLIKACIEDIGDGYGADLTPGFQLGFLAELHAESHPERLYKHRSLERPGTSAGKEYRRRQGTLVDLDPLELVRNLRTSYARHQTWRMLSLTEELQAGFGDSWLVREAVLAARSSGDSPGGSRANLANGSEAKAVAAWLRQAQHHSDDSSWWLGQAPSSDDTLAARTWLAALVLFTKSSSLQECTPRMDLLLRELSAHEVASLISTVHRYSTHRAPRRLDLREVVHRRKLDPSPLAALLLHEVAFDSTRAELFRIIYEGFADISTLRSDIAKLAISALSENQARPLNPRTFRGARNSVPRGSFGQMRIAELSTSLAEKVLGQPGQWPADIVVTASLVLSSSLSGLPALANVAREGGWFPDASEQMRPYGEVRPN